VCRPPVDPASTAMACIDDTCLNRAVKVECGHACPAGKRCGNQVFAKRLYAAVEVRPSGEKGHGLFARAPLRSGQFVLEYVGEIVGGAEKERRIARYANSPHFYLMSLQGDDSIDATRKGNHSRFINHACAPNCETQKWEVGGRPCVGLFACRDIAAGEEITFDYKYERYGGAKQRCFCGAPNCAKYLGGKVKPLAATGPSAASAVAAGSAEAEGKGSEGAANGPRARIARDWMDVDPAGPRLSPEEEDVVATSAKRILRRMPPVNSAAAASNPPQAKPWQSFPRALRRALPLRLLQLVTLFRSTHAQLVSAAMACGRPPPPELSVEALRTMLRQATPFWPPLMASELVRVGDVKEEKEESKQPHVKSEPVQPEPVKVKIEEPAAALPAAVPAAGIPYGQEQIAHN